MAKRVAEKESEAGVKAEVKAPPRGVLVRVCALAWLVPGLGHFLLKRKGRGGILFAAIVGMFLLGIGMQGEFFRVASGSYLRTLGFFGQMCVGLPLPVTRFFGYSGGNPYFVSSDYGTAFLVAAGMLNVLCVLDAYDIAMGRKP